MISRRERSYGIYIWHWVIFQVTRPSVDLSGQTWALYLARVLLVLALADISLRWVEIPFRQGLVQDWFRGMKYRSAKVQLRQKISVISSIIIVLAITSSISVQAINKSDEVANQILQQNTKSKDTGSSKGIMIAVVLGILILVVAVISKNSSSESTTVTPTPAASESAAPTEQPSAEPSGAPLAAHEAPVGIVSLYNATGATVNWKAPAASEGITGYNIELRDNGASCAKV